MRRRLVSGVLVTVLLTAVLIGVPLVIGSNLGIRAVAQRDVDASVQRASRLVELTYTADEPFDPSNFAAYASPSRQYVITTPQGERFVIGPDPNTPTVTATDTTGGYTVQLTESVSNFGSWKSIAVRIAITAVIAGIIAFFISRRRARRVADEMEQLAEDAAKVGAGDAGPSRRYGVPELDAVADALDASAARVNQLIEVERGFASDVAHQLRTPLTAISLRLDEVLESTDLEEARIEAAAAHEQVARLAGVIDDLLRTARDREIDQVPVDVDAVLAQQRREWLPVYSTAGRRLEVADAQGVHVIGAAGLLRQVVAALLENAAVHGAGTVRVSIRRQVGSVVLQVGDEGPGVDPDLAPRIFERRVSGARGHGIGLAMARALAEHMGGRLELAQQRPPRFELFLRDADARAESSATPSGQDAPEEPASGSGSDTMGRDPTTVAMTSSSLTPSPSGKTQRR